MNKENEILEILQSKNVEYKEHGPEILVKCIFNGCDDDSRGNEYHMYINKHGGTYYCHKCAEKGNVATLRKHFGIEHPVKTKRMLSITKQAEKAQMALPDNIRRYLIEERLILDEEIADRQIGYQKDSNGSGWITIPVFDIHGNTLFMKLRRDPYVYEESQPKYKSTGGEATMYNAQALVDKPDTLVICEGEFDCMVLASNGIPAVCSTAGAGTFKDAWIEGLNYVREFYICLDKDDAGEKGANALVDKICQFQPHASILKVVLPDEVGEHGDITDYFKNNLGTIEDLFGVGGRYVHHVGGEKPIDASRFKEMELDELSKVLDLTIKHDNENKLITFLCMLSAYTGKSQINVTFNAPSSSGKSYIAIEVASLFPEADKIMLSGASPTSFYHGEGKYDKERKAKIVSLERKILIFLEQPDPQLQEKLRSVLSHDKWSINYRITNKDKQGANRAELIIIEGFPSTIFCSAALRLDEQEATRAILLSPEVTKNKILDSVSLSAYASADSNSYALTIDSNSERNGLKDRIIAIKREQVDDIVIVNPEEIISRFTLLIKNKAKPRHSRDIKHLMYIVKAIALLNVWYRKNSSGDIVARQQDIDQAFTLWEKFSESQNLNISPAVLTFYKQYIIPAFDEKSNDIEHMVLMNKGAIGISRQEVLSYYTKIEGVIFNDEYLRKQILPQLENSGLITQQKPTEGDKRSKHIFPLLKIDEQNYIGQGEGVEEKVDVNELFDY